MEYMAHYVVGGQQAGSVTPPYIVGQVNYKAAVVLRVSHGSRFLA